MGMSRAPRNKLGWGLGAVSKCQVVLLTSVPSLWPVAELSGAAAFSGEQKQPLTHL